MNSLSVSRVTTSPHAPTLGPSPKHAAAALLVLEAVVCAQVAVCPPRRCRAPASGRGEKPGGRVRGAEKAAPEETSDSCGRAVYAWVAPSLTTGCRGWVPN
ncbi:hypothetical protein VCV18_000613 [Metarhizium anisopliae]